MIGVTRLLRLDFRLLVSRPLYRTVIAAGIGAAALIAISAEHEGSGAWWKLAQSVRLLVPLELAFGAVIGAVSLAGDAASGALRGIMMRPVSRTAIVVSRATTLVSGMALAYAVAIITATVCAAIADDFGAITYGEGEATAELVGAAELRRDVPRLILLSFPAILCAPLIGLALSAIFEDAATAAVLGLVAALSPFLADAFAGAAQGWLFTHAAVESIATVSQLSEGILTGVEGTRGGGFLLHSVAIPFACGTLAVVVAGIVFRRRDFQS